jgi:hypothetical protein
MIKFQWGAILANVISINSRRKRALTNPGALDFLREAGRDGPLLVASYADLATRLGWTRDRTRKAVCRWRKDGRAVIETGPGNELRSIRAMPDRRGVRGQGTGVSKDKTRGQKGRKKGGQQGPKPADKRGDSAPDKAADIVPFSSGDEILTKPAKSSTYDLKSNSQEALPDAGFSAAAEPKTSPAPPPAAPPPDTTSENRFMGLFSRTKKPAETPPEPVAEEAAQPVEEGGQNARSPASGYGPPVAVRYSPQSPVRYAEQLDWRLASRNGGEMAVPPAQAEEQPRIGKWTLCAALVMAGFSTVLTVMGFAVLLPGWLLLSMGLGAAMEFGRLVIVGVATRSWRELNGWLRAGALVYIVLAEGVSLIGVYSELHNLHTGTRPTVAAAVEQSRAEASAQVDYQKSVIADLDRQMAALDRDSAALIAADARRGRVKDGRDLMTTQSRQQAQLVEQRRQAAARLASLQGDAAKATGKAAVIDAEVGSVRQVAALLRIDAGEALRWWLLAITLLIGPAASLLIAMATGRSTKRRAA